MEGKKSFVLYADLIHVVRKLPPEKRGELFMVILEYVNDLNPKIDDMLLDLVFEPIRLQLKRDLIKYKERAKRARENGSLGGRPKNPEEPKEPSGLQGNPEEPRKPDTVNDTDSVNGNDSKKAFAADANRDEKGYRLYFFNLVKEREVSRDQLFLKAKVNLSLRNEIWADFIENSIINVPLIEDEKHAWNTFKKFIQDNGKNYSGVKRKTGSETFDGF